MSEVYGPDAPSDRTQEQAVAICMNYWREAHGGTKTSVDDLYDSTPSVDEGESESDYMDRCSSELASEFEDADEEAILTACEQSWTDYAEQDSFKSKPGIKSGKRRKRTTKQAEDPEPGESYDDFMNRCTSELMDSDEIQQEEADSLCQEAWDESEVSQEESYKPKPGVTNFKTHSGKVSGMEFILSDETPDRLGDIISASGWDLENFQKNPIALFNHNSNFPIGRWHGLKAADGALRGHLEMAPKGTSERIDEIRKLIEAGILRAVSVGFKPIERKPRTGPKDEYLGDYYVKQELVETSLVSVPANPNALAVAKSLNISPATMDMVFAGTGKRDTVPKRRSMGGFARSQRRQQRSRAMTLAQRIIDIQSAITDRKTKLDEHLQKLDDSNVSDADLQTSNDLNAEIARLEKQHGTLVESEKLLGASVAANGKGNGKAVVVHATPKNGKEVPLTSTIGKKDLDLLDYLVRAGTVAYVAKNWGKNPQEVALAIYGDDEPTRFMTDLVLRAASAPAMTTVVGWAAELVQQTYVAMMPTLMPKGILTRLGARGMTLTFGRAGKINIPTRSRTPSIAGSFVGEGQAIPVRQGAFTSQALTPKKMAVITTWTREMDEHSVPAIEGILREAIQADTTVAVDSVLIDANPATTIRPAGLLNGVAAQTPTAGGGIAAVVGDLKLLIGSLTTATFGNIRSPTWLMNPTDMLSLSLISATGTGVFPFKEEVANGNLLTIPIIDSGTIPAKTVVLVDAADFVVVGGEAPRFEISDQATLHMEDTAPADLVGPGSPGTVAAPQRSLFQTDSLALRMIMPLNWVQRRAGTIAWTQNVTW